MEQTTGNVLLVRPSRFGYNPQTAATNTFQSKSPSSTGQDIQHKALAEFEQVVSNLKDKGVNVHVADDLPLPEHPDAVFPNNWVSFHHDGTVVLYPMEAPNRRWERRREIIQSLESSFLVKEVLDISPHEKEGKFLEGTGSMVFDHLHGIAYGCLSSRTNKELFSWICDRFGYRPVLFTAHDRSGKKIYHTNVMMSVGKQFAIVCLASLIDADERKRLHHALADSGHEIVDISIKQMEEFAGNMLELKTGRDGSIVALSKRADDSLTTFQKDLLGRYSHVTPLDIPTIEAAGGGSVRCMIAEIFLPKKGKA